MTALRIAAVIGLNPSSSEEYERLHRDVWPEVLEQIARSHIRNYSIYRYGDLLFSYYEYIGADHDADLAAMAADPATRRWWTVCSPLQRPVPERAPGEWWHVLAEVFYTAGSTDDDPITPQTSDA